VVERIGVIKKNKPLKNVGDLKEFVDYFSNRFDGFSCLNPSGLVKQLPLYLTALDWQLGELSQSYDTNTAVTNAGKISGISYNNFTQKNFMGKYTTGGEKMVWGNPYAIKEFKSLKPLLTKASGQLEVNIDIEREEARYLKLLIDSAGVSSFYLGKKGLAYVSDIRI
jgi:hypothetical protein